jgi:dTDP-4-amino-4,6-dideoxygalactose transaminase
MIDTLNTIRMVDLVGQYERIKDEIDAALVDVANSSAYINGPEVQAFQKELEDYLDVKHVIPCGNGTDALQIAMMALGLEPGDEVLVPNFTFIATAEVIALLGLTPVLVDVDPRTFNMDPDATRKAITSKCKAIVPVHLFGQCADMDLIQDIAKEFGLFVIEDNAQAIGADYTTKDGKTLKAGTIGHFGTTSFFPSKNLGAMGDGGAIFTNDDDLAQKARVIANHGMEVRYYHDLVGVNSRLDSMQAAVLRIKLRHLDEYCDSRRKAADFYDQAFAEIDTLETPLRAANSTHVFHQYTLKIKGISREGLRDHLQSFNIPSMIYYPVPLHLQKAYEDPRYQKGQFPVTEDLCECVLSLPMHTELSGDQLSFITEKVISYIKS